MAQEVTIIIADDHPLVRKGLKDVIEDQGEFNIVGEAADGEQALKLIEELNPTIAIIDIHMPKINGLEVVKSIKKKKLDVGLIILTMYDKENIFNHAMDLGIKGYVMKDSALTEIVDAVRIVAMGKYYISSSISGFLVKKKQFRTASNDETGISKLTTAEIKILRMIAANMTSNEIADELFLSVYTVNTHRSNICKKLNIHGPNALLHFILDHPDLV